MSIRSLLLITMLTLPGCVMSWDHEHEYTRKAFDRNDVARMVIGSTTREWVSDTFGTPDSQLVHSEGGELWKYRNRGNRDVRFLMFPVIDVDVQTDQIETLSVRIENEVVTDYWIINDES